MANDRQSEVKCVGEGSFEVTMPGLGTTVAAEQVAGHVVSQVRSGFLSNVNGVTGTMQSAEEEDVAELDVAELDETAIDSGEDSLAVKEISLPEDPNTNLTLEQIQDILLLCRETQYMTAEQKGILARLLCEDQRILRNNRSVANKGQAMNAAYVICTLGPNGGDKQLEGKNGKDEWFQIPAPSGRIFGHSVMLGDESILKGSTNSTIDLRVPETDSAGIRVLAIASQTMENFKKACPEGMLNFLRALFETATDILAKEQPTATAKASYGVSKIKLVSVLQDLEITGESQTVEADQEIKPRPGMIAIVISGEFNINKGDKRIRHCNVQPGAEEILFERFALGKEATANIIASKACQVTYYNIEDLLNITKDLSGQIDIDRLQLVEKFWKTLFCSALHRRMS